MTLPSFLSQTDLGPSAFDQLRVEASDLARQRNWAELWDLRLALRGDETFWPDLWAPLVAVAAQHLGNPDAFHLLEEAVRGGFRQPEVLEGEIEAAFSAHPDWEHLLTRMRHHQPTALDIELLEWPTVEPAAKLELLRIGDRTQELVALLPPAEESSWTTARAVLVWVTQRWKHGNAHLEVDDAIECLQRVGRGQRFACVEYALVLSQALNSLQIPSRRLFLRQQNYQTGIGRGHVVSEAWIDELERWIVLDGQNGMYWAEETGVPLSAAELQEALRRGLTPTPITPGRTLSGTETTLWLSYFFSITTTAGTWSAGPLSLVFQRTRLLDTGRVERSPDALYPDLNQIAVRSALVDGRPALRFESPHPYSCGFARDGKLLDGDILFLDEGPQEALVSAVTPYGQLSAQRVRWRVQRP